MVKRKKSLLYESSARARMCFVYAQNCMHESLAPLHKIHTKTNTTTQIYTHIAAVMHSLTRTNDKHTGKNHCLVRHMLSAAVLYVCKLHTLNLSPFSSWHLSN